MRNMSFALTTDQIRNRTKTVTRRIGWRFARAGDRIQACVKCMGLQPGEQIERLCVIRVTDVRRERLDRMASELGYGRLEVAREGFPNLSGSEFVALFCSHMRCEPSLEVTRIEFAYEPETGEQA